MSFTGEGVRWRVTFLVDQSVSVDHNAYNTTSHFTSCQVTLTSPVTSCQVALTSPVTSCQVTLTSPVTSCRVTLTSPVTSCQVTLTSPITSCQVTLTSLVTSCQVTRASSPGSYARRRWSNALRSGCMITSSAASDPTSYRSLWSVSFRWVRYSSHIGCNLCVYNQKCQQI